LLPFRAVASALGVAAQDVVHGVSCGKLVLADINEPTGGGPGERAQ